MLFASGMSAGSDNGDGVCCMDEAGGVGEARGVGGADSVSGLGPIVELSRQICLQALSLAQNGIAQISETKTKRQADASGPAQAWIWRVLRPRRGVRATMEGGSIREGQLGEQINRQNRLSS